MGHRSSEERAQAVRLAIADIKRTWEKEHGREPTQTQLAQWFGVTQQTMSTFAKENGVGQKLADGVADHLKTTVDGVIKLYGKEWREVRVSDIPGWRDAVEQARREAGEPGESFEWAAAGDVVLPIAPRLATAAFAHDLAYLLTRHVRASGLVRRARQKGA